MNYFLLFVYYSVARVAFIASNAQRPGISWDLKTQLKIKKAKLRSIGLYIDLLYIKKLSTSIFNTNGKTKLKILNAFLGV